MSLERYVGLTLGLALITLLPLLAFAGLDDSGRLATIVGTALAATNTICAYTLVLVARRQRSLQAFMGLVLGGMGVRLTLLLVAIAGGGRLFGFSQTPLTFSILAYFTLFLVLELAVLHARPGIVEAR